MIGKIQLENYEVIHNRITGIVVVVNNLCKTSVIQLQVTPPHVCHIDEKGSFVVFGNARDNKFEDHQTEHRVLMELDLQDRINLKYFLIERGVQFIPDRFDETSEENIQMENKLSLTRFDITFEKAKGRLKILDLKTGFNDYVKCLPPFKFQLTSEGHLKRTGSYERVVIMNLEQSEGNTLINFLQGFGVSICTEALSKLMNRNKALGFVPEPMFTLSTIEPLKEVMYYGDAKEHTPEAPVSHSEKTSPEDEHFTWFTFKTRLHGDIEVFHRNGVNYFEHEGWTYDITDCKLFKMEGTETYMLILGYGEREKLAINKFEAMAIEGILKEVKNGQV